MGSFAPVSIYNFYKPFSHLLTLTLSGSISAQYHSSSLFLHVNPLSHILSCFSRGSRLQGSPTSFKQTLQQPHLSFTTAVLQFLTEGHAYLGSGQSPALLHQQAGQSGIGVGASAETNDRERERNPATNEATVVIACTNCKFIKGSFADATINSYSLEFGDLDTVLLLTASMFCCRDTLKLGTDRSFTKRDRFLDEIWHGNDSM